MKKTNIYSLRRFATVGLALSLGLVFSISCEKNDDDNTALLAGLALLNSGSNTAASNNAAVTVSGVSAASSSIASQAGGGTLTHALFPQSDRAIARLMLQKQLDKQMGKEPAPHLMLTALSTTTGSCNSTGCNATIDGTLSCSQGGTMTLSNYQVNFTISYTGPTDFSFNGTNNGSISFASCVTQAYDWMNMPNVTTTTLSGDVTVSGTSGMTLSGATNGSGQIALTYVFSNDLTIQSSNLSYNGSTPTSVDVREIANLTEVTTIVSNTVTTSGTITTWAFTFDVALTGTVTRTGSIGGVPVNDSHTFNGETYRISGSCTIDSANSNSISCTAD